MNILFVGPAAPATFIEALKNVLPADAHIETSSPEALGSSVVNAFDIAIVGLPSAAEASGAWRAAMERIVQSAMARKRAESERNDAQAKMFAELQAAYKNLEDFAHTVSHDLQSPLRKISSFSDLVRLNAGPNVSEKAAHYLDRIASSAKRAIDLISGLLEFSKKSSKRDPLQLTDTSEVLRDVFSELEVSMETLDVRVEMESLPLVMVRRQQLYYLFFNLIENAIKYRGEKPCEIKVNAVRSGSEWIFSVQDNGIGIDPKEWDQVFHIFRRLENAHKQEGSGIGLTICKKIVENHGGRIWISSQVGVGSTFYFSLPA